MSEGTLDSPRLKARIAMPGGDWFPPGGDGFGQPDVRVQFLTDDDAVIQHLFVAEGRLTAKDRIEYRVYRVT